MRVVRGGILTFFLFLFLFLAPTAQAHCPLCIVGAGAGLSLSRLLGIDDSIAGVWMAALLGAIAFWTYSSLSKKWRFPFSKPLIYIGLFGLTIWSFYSFNDFAISKYNFVLINTHAGQIFGLDKLTFGIVTGGILFYLVDIIDDFIIKRHGRVYFPFQRIIVSLGSMLVWSLLVWVLINYYI